MSELRVKVCTVDSIERHPMADRLAVATIGGWRTCIRFNPESQKPEIEVGSKCVYFPPDAVLPNELAAKLGVVNYCDKIETGYRVKAARLRGVPSYGFVVGMNSGIVEADTPIGTDVANLLGVTKWEPPVANVIGDGEKPNVFFHTYTDIQNIGNFPDMFADGEEVVFTEKIHGTNCRIGVCLEDGEFKLMGGSHNTRRKQFNARSQLCDYWRPLESEALNHLLGVLKDDFKPNQSIIIFGEIFGSGVQDMTYGLERGTKYFRVFDIAVDGKYLDYDVKLKYCSDCRVEMVPILYRGPYSRSKVEEYTNGNTTMMYSNSYKGFMGREGIVITPRKEGTFGFERKILKSISVDYLARKGGTDSH